MGQSGRGKHNPDWRSAKSAEGAYERSRAEARRGLVYGPYLGAPPRASLTVAVGGACAKVRRKFLTPRPNPYRPPRGTVREFSRKSRTRLQQTLCAMPIDHVSRGVLFVTLTYPAKYPGEWAVWKRQIDNWLHRLRRRLPRSAGVWKLEPQTRGAPHFHLLMIGAPFMAKEWLSRSWYEIVGSGDPKHLAAGTNVQLARSHRGVVAYAAKYTAKRNELPADWQDGVGRYWGVFNRAGLGIAWDVNPLSQRDFYRVCRILRGLIARRKRAAGRGPPRVSSHGMWAVLRAPQAARILNGL